RRSSQMLHIRSVDHGPGDCKPTWHFLLPASRGHLVLLTHGGPPAAKPARRARRPRPHPRRVGPGGAVLGSRRRSGFPLRSPLRRGAGWGVVVLRGGVARGAGAGGAPGVRHRWGGRFVGRDRRAPPHRSLPAAGGPAAGVRRGGPAAVARGSE